MYWKPTLIMFSLLFGMTALLGQVDDSNKVLDEIYLKNGSIFRGEIMEYEQGEKLKVRLQNGQEIEILDEEIEKIVQGSVNPVEIPENNLKKPKKPIELRNEGMYNSTYTSFASGTNRFDQFTLGAGIHNVTGFHLNPKIGVGLGIGIDNYSRRGETILPIYAELRYIPFEKNKALYLMGSAGWGFAFKREQFGILEARGGYMVHPAIGYRAGTSDGTNVTIDVGMKLQDSFFKERLNNNDLEFRDIVFKRVVVRIGLTLWKQ